MNHQELSDKIYDIKDKLTDIEFKEIMDLIKPRKEKLLLVQYITYAYVPSYTQEHYNCGEEERDHTHFKVRPFEFSTVIKGVDILPHPVVSLKFLQTYSLTPDLIEAQYVNLYQQESLPETTIKDISVIVVATEEL